MGRHGRERKDRQWNTGKEKRKRKSGRTRCGSEDLSHKAREVEGRLLVSGIQPGDRGRDGRHNSERAVPSGLYLYSMKRSC